MPGIPDPAQRGDNRQADEGESQHRLCPSAFAIPAVRDGDPQSHKPGRRQVLQKRCALGQDSPCPPLRPTAIQVGI